LTAQYSSPSTGRQITAHPLFPTGVGLWFAALFSLSSLAIRGSLLEALIVATHIDYLIPAASPPLGGGARLVMALLVAGAGWYVGRRVGQRIAQSEADAEPFVSTQVFGVPPYQAHSPYQDGSARRPFQVNEEVGGYYPPAPAPWGQEHGGHYSPPMEQPHAQFQAQYEAPYQPQYPGQQQTDYQPGFHPPYQAAYPEAHGQPAPGYSAYGEQAPAGHWHTAPQPAEAPFAYPPAEPFGAPYPLEPYQAHAYAEQAYPPQVWPGEQVSPAAAMPAYPHPDYYPAAPEPAGYFAQAPMAPPQDVASWLAPVAEPHPAADSQGWGEAFGAAPAAMAEPAPVAPAPSAPTAYVRPVAELRAEHQAEPAPRDPLDALSHLELMNRLAMAMQRHEGDPAGPATAGTGVQAGSHSRENDEAISPVRSALAALRALK
jgi:hypothetical protein